MESAQGADGWALMQTAMIERAARATFAAQLFRNGFDSDGAAFEEAWLSSISEGERKVLLEDAKAALNAVGALELATVVMDFRQKLATYASVYKGDKELRRLLSDCDAALSKVAL